MNNVLALLECVFFAILLISVIILISRVGDLKSRIDMLYAFSDAHLLRIKALEEKYAILDEDLDIFDERIASLERAHLHEEEEFTKEFETPDLHEDEMLSINERILLREAEFDKRINAMKYAPGEVIPLHPDVKNIRHDVVDLRANALPDVEVTE